MGIKLCVLFERRLCNVCSGRGVLCLELTKARSHVDKILSNLPSLISSSTISSYQLIQLVAVNLYALFHSKKHLNAAAGSVAEETGLHQNGDVAGNNRSESDTRPTSSALHASYDKLMFSFTGTFELIARLVICLICLSVLLQVDWQFQVSCRSTVGSLWI